MKMTILVQLGYFTSFCKKNIHGNKSVIWNSFFMLYFCFVRIQWSLWCYFRKFPSLNNSEGLAPFVRQGKARNGRKGNCQAFILWSKFWSGPRHLSWCQHYQVLKSIFGQLLLCSSFSEGQVRNPEGAWRLFLTWWGGGILSWPIRLNAR